MSILPSSIDPAGEKWSEADLCQRHVRCAARREVLAQLGVSGALAEEVLAANTPSVGGGSLPTGFTFPLPDQVHLEVWREYADQVAAGQQVPAVLLAAFPQLSFPIVKGISGTAAYRAATRRGEYAEQKVALGLLAPEHMTLELHRCLAGTVPVLTAPSRGDFVAMVRALSARNEPVGIPDSMGACLVSGITNWDRVRRYREGWLASHPNASEGEWRQELAALAARKELYQDRLILVGHGPYSGLEASSVGLPPAEWESSSLLLRRAHECTHYLALRVFGKLQHNLWEELVADFVGLLETFGEYRAELAQRFLGIEALPYLRPGGRLANYRGSPPLSQEALAVQALLAHGAILVLAELAAEGGVGVASPQRLGRLICALLPLALEELLLPAVQGWLREVAGGPAL